MAAKAYEINNYDVKTIENNGKTKIDAVDTYGNLISHELTSDKVTKVTFGNTTSNKSIISLSLSTNINASSRDVINEYDYDDNENLIYLNNNGVIYEFVYDDADNFLYGTVNGQKQYDNQYDLNNNLTKTTYANGQTIEYTYDELNRYSSVSYNGNIAFRYTYSEGLAKETNLMSGKTTTYTIADDETVTGITGNNFDFSFSFNETGRPISNVLNYGDIKNEIYFSDNKTTFGTNSIEYVKDEFDRVVNEELNINGQTFLVEKTYGSDDVFDLNPTQLKYSNLEYDYEYDPHGNLINVKTGDEYLYEYYYDNLNQLVREDNVKGQITVNYTYDSNGNILNKTVYAYKDFDNILEEFNYQYDGNASILTKLNGQLLSYDEVGNPATYKDYEMTWNQGRRLQAIKNDELSACYKYNNEGYRTSKTINGITTDYTLYKDKVIYQQTENDILYFIYNIDDELIGFIYNDSSYYYLRNPQKDIIGIIDCEGNIIVEYVYDAYGKILDITGSQADTIGLLNPYRYKGYRYDNEINMYYLNSRYYDPELGRFFNADDIYINGQNAEVLPYYNLFAYGNNNPIKYYDPSGHAAVLIIGGVVLTVGEIILITALICLAFLLIFYPDEVGYVLESVYYAISDFFRTAKNSMTNWWEKLTKSPKINRHHIVAQNASKAEPARKVLRSVNINPVTDERNIVSLKQRYHAKIHTTSYYVSVNLCFSGKDYKPFAVNSTLFVLKALLSIMNVFC